MKPIYFHAEITTFYWCRIKIRQNLNGSDQIDARMVALETYTSFNEKR